jgi:hypothetical protein
MRVNAASPDGRRPLFYGQSRGLYSIRGQRITGRGRPDMRGGAVPKYRFFW